MMKKIRLLLPLVMLVAVLAGLTWLALSQPSRGTPGTGSQAISRGDDSPWDPGDETDPHPKPHSKHNEAGGKGILLADKDGDKPWDPGDEAPRRRDANHA